MRSRPLRLFLGAEVLFTLGYFLLPPSGLKAASYAGLGFAAAAALVVGARAFKPRQSLAWYLLGAGLFSLTAGDTLNNSYEWVLKTEAPFPSPADAVYLAFAHFWWSGCSCWSGPAPRAATAPA